MDLRARASLIVLVTYLVKRTSIAMPAIAPPDSVDDDEVADDEFPNDDVAEGSPMIRICAAWTTYEATEALLDLESIKIG